MADPTTDAELEELKALLTEFRDLPTIAVIAHRVSALIARLEAAEGRRQGKATRVPRAPAYAKPPSWGGLYVKHFPHNTDGASRHVKCFAGILREIRNPVRALISEYQEPDHIASSMEVTVRMLWEARARIAELEAALAKAEA